jgi:hypothetical protein
MYEAAERAREGDVDYFRSLAPQELSSLIVGRDEDGRTLFHTAAANGHMELLELLAGSGATKVANKQDDEVTMPAVLPSPCHQSNCQHIIRPEAVGQLPAAEAVLIIVIIVLPKQYSISTVKHITIVQCSNRLVGGLVHHPPPVCCCCCVLKGWTPLHSAVSSGREKIVAALLQFDATPDVTNSGGQTALHYAVSGLAPCSFVLRR